MNRTDRLLAIVLELQAKKQVRAEDLAATFEVSKRTIYRDLDALSESGVPVMPLPGQGFALVEGYFLPPLSFTTDEAIMLLLGADFVAQNFDAHYRGAAQLAGHKILTILPEPLRREVEYLQSSIKFIAFNELTAPETLQQVRRAIIQHRRVRFQYYARYGSTGTGGDKSNSISLREADPYALLYVGASWMMVAYCHVRRDIRHFRLDRMENLALLDRLFTRPADFKIELSDQGERAVVVRALFDHEIKRWVQESASGYQIAAEDHPDGLLATFTIRQPEDLLSWLLSWGSHVRVLEPDSLREMMAHEARKILEQHHRQKSAKSS